MAEFSLVPHPDYPPRAVNGVTVEIDADPNAAMLTYIIHGERNAKLPPPATSSRTDNLWQTTCFELFLKLGSGTEYVEFNFSPSGQWAAYAFLDYRAGMRDLALTVPPHVERHGESWMIDVDLTEVPMRHRAMGVTAVIEELDGTRSYWALAHAPGPPDFHNPDCFIATLPAPTLP